MELLVHLFTNDHGEWQLIILLAQEQLPFLRTYMERPLTWLTTRLTLRSSRASKQFGNAQQCTLAAPEKEATTTSCGRS